MTRVLCDKCGKVMDYTLGCFHCECGAVKSVFEIEGYFDFKEPGGKDNYER